MSHAKPIRLLTSVFKFHLGSSGQHAYLTAQALPRAASLMAPIHIRVSHSRQPLLPSSNHLAT